MMSSLGFSDFTKEILSVDIIFCVLLVWLETWLQKVFICPCDSSRFFSVSLCVCSSIIIIFIALFIQMHKYKEELQKRNWQEWKTWQDNWTTLTGVALPVLISVFTWLTLWFYRGNYFVCQETIWDGTWTTAEEPYKWCQPSNYNSTFKTISVELFKMSVVCYIFIGYSYSH